MKRLLVLITALLLAACSSMPAWVPGSGWNTLIDGDKGLENFNRLGDANWRAEGGAIVADKASENSYLVTKNSYKDFQIRAEFWADHNTNSGIFIRATDPKKIGAWPLRGEHLRPAPRAGVRHRRDRRRRQGAGAAEASGRRQVEHLPDHRQGLADHGGVQRRKDGGRAERQVPAGAVRAAVRPARQDGRRSRSSSARCRSASCSARVFSGSGRGPKQRH